MSYTRYSARSSSFTIAVSVSLPTWSSNIGYEEGDPAITTKMKGGYPRFVFHPLVKQLIAYYINRFAEKHESCLIFSSRLACEQCRQFLGQGRIVELALNDNSTILNADHIQKLVIVHGIFFDFELASKAKQFWQHTGQIISSRKAEHCLRLLDALQSPPTAESKANRGRSRYQESKNKTLALIGTLLDTAIDMERAMFVEERFGRNLDMSMVAQAEKFLKQRIAGVIGDGEPLSSQNTSIDGTSVSEDDVYLFPTGMAAIFQAHLMVLDLFEGKSVQFGFPYLDTLKIQEKFGPGCFFLGHGDDSDLAKLKKMLTTNKISSVFCEYPSNPLLKSPPLKDLWQLSLEHNFLLIVDETVGNPVNISCLHSTDILVSSLTKIFSGDSNVMGGSLVLNSKSPRYAKLKQWMIENYQSDIWYEDVIFLERNSRTFTSRILQINHNAEALCDAIKNHPEVDKIYYPKYDPHYYNQFSTGKGYGGLFSIVLKNEEKAKKFYDSIEICKGPSLGTNFTLACPYTILAHYFELDWAAQFNVEKQLIRVSVGLENPDDLINVFISSLDLL